MIEPNLLYGLIIYGVGIAVLVFLSHTLMEAGRRMAPDGRRTAIRLVTGLWIWAAATNLYALNTGPEFVWLAPAIALPIALITTLTYVAPVSRLLENISVAKLVGVQVYRNAGAVFLLAHFGFGHYLSREFALNAGWGDVLTGVLAVPVAAAAYYRVRFWEALVAAWCLIGTADLIVAPITAQIYGAMRIDDFPLNSIPLFFGPPLGISLHIVAVRALWLQRQARRMANPLPAHRSAEA
ncbi:MAG: hypothetical protein AAGF59_13635 [Pseudomonadota bacterium]